MIELHQAAKRFSERKIEEERIGGMLKLKEEQRTKENGIAFTYLKKQKMPDNITRTHCKR